MARRRKKKKRRSRKKKALISVFGLVGALKAFVFPFANEAGNNIDLIRKGDYTTPIARVSKALTGFDPRNGQFNPVWLKEGLVPLIVAGLASKFARKFGVNRYLKKSTMGLLEV